MYTKNHRNIGISSRNLIILFALLFCNDICGQIYTPQGNFVEVIKRDEQLTVAEKEAIRQKWSQTYPRAICLEEATTIYNCHAYAWSVSEGGEKCWMNTPNDVIYMTDGSYTQTNRYDPKATKVSYGNDDHSAILFSNGSNYFISKWGSGCLMKHTYNDCPYNSANLKYYKLSMEISGDEFIVLPDDVSSVNRRYTLSNVPQGATVTWKLSGGGKIVSGQGNNSIQVEIPFSGNYSVSASVHCSTGLIVNIPFRLNVVASAAPIITDIEIFKYMQENGEFTLRAVSNRPDGIFTWYVSGNNAQLCDIPYPDDASFSPYPNCYKAMHVYEPGIYTVTVVGHNANNGDSYTYSKNFNITEVVSGFPNH